MIEILEAETEPLLDEKMYQELRRVCELADGRHKDEELSYRCSCEGIGWGRSPAWAAHWLTNP